MQETTQDVNSTFGVALILMQEGKRVARRSWNGKKFVYYVPANSYPVQTQAAKEFFGENSMVPYNPYLAIKNVDNTVSTWLPSVDDLFANDWYIVW